MEQKLYLISLEGVDEAIYAITNEGRLYREKLMADVFSQSLLKYE